MSASVDSASQPRAGAMHGPAWLGEDRTRFSIWAPSVDRLALDIEGRALQPMQRESEGWFSLDADAAQGTAYRYRLAQGDSVPDPASRAQRGDVDGYSLVVDHAAYDWQCMTWRGRPWIESVVYELHIGLLGGFDVARGELPRLAALGITVVELMPVADFAGQRNWGYDGVLPFAPDASYGTPDALKAFVDAAHALGMSIWLDVVYNHFGPMGNHLAQYAQPLFKAEGSSAWGERIDFSQVAVRRFFIDNARHWLFDYRFDGLRFDAVHAIGDTGFLHEMAATLRREAGPGRHIHLVLENEDNDAALLGEGLYDAQWNDDFHNALHVLMTGEHESYYGNYSEAPMRHLLRALTEGFAYQGEPMPAQQGRRRGTPSAGLPPTAFLNFLQNHDQVGNRARGERLSSLVEPAALRAAQALLLLSPAIPMLFMGEEIDSRTPFFFFTDFPEPLATAVREGRRREFAAFSAFADEAAREAIPDPNEPETFERSRPLPPGVAEGEAATMRIAALLALRRRELLPRLDGCRALGAEAIGPKAFVARWRLGDGTVLRIACNLDRQPVPAASTTPARLLHETAPGAGSQWQRGRLVAHSTVVELAEA